MKPISIQGGDVLGIARYHCTECGCFIQAHEKFCENDNPNLGKWHWPTCGESKRLAADFHDDEDAEQDGYDNALVPVPTQTITSTEFFGVTANAYQQWAGNTYTLTTDGILTAIEILMKEQT